MPINTLNYISFDFETGGLKPGWHEAVEIGAQVYGPNFEPIGGEAGMFNSLMRPLHPDRLDDKALAVNGRTKNELMVAPDQRAVWRSFITWAESWKAKGASFGGKPIACGKNIRAFDLLFVDELNKLHAPKGDKQYIFNQRINIDLEDFLFHWFNHTDDLERYAMDPVRKYFGMPPSTASGAHAAYMDAKQSGDIIMRFLKFYKAMFNKTTKQEDGSHKRFVDFRDCFKGKA